MYFTAPVTPSIEQKLETMKSLSFSLRSIIESVSPTEVVVSTQGSLYKKVRRVPSTYYLLKEGSLKCVRYGKVLYFLEEGDIIGFEGSQCDSLTDFEAEFAVSLCEVNLLEILKDADSLVLWGEYQANFSSIFTIGHFEGGKADTVFSPEVRSFMPGEFILEQGSAGDEVFSLIDGMAETIINGAVVGMVGQDQIFGAVSVLTNTERMASVRAKSDCLAVVFSKDQFLALANNKPDTLIKLAEDLSRAIISINDHVVGSLKIPG
jgi:CRP/FNR family cyclic AMP-dependent transcriptional regulator